MKFPKTYKLSKFADMFGFEFRGDPDQPVSGINEIHRVEDGDIVFVDVEKYFKKAFNSAATIIILNKDVEPPIGKGLLLSDDPFSDFNRILEYFNPTINVSHSKKPKVSDYVSLGKNVVFGKGVKVGKHVEIGHNVVIGSHVTIGDNTIIHSNVTIYGDVQIGANCVINSGTVIGSDAFYYKKRTWGRERMYSKGRVVISDFVEIGANTTIDRGVTSDTFIGEHTKIDNLVQIGHDTIIGCRCVIAAQVGIAGCSQIQDDVILWGQAGVPSDITIGQGSVLMAKSGAMSDLAPGKTYLGFVAKETRQALRDMATLSKLSVMLPFLENLLEKSGLNAEKTEIVEEKPKKTRSKSNKNAEASTEVKTTRKRVTRKENVENKELGKNLIVKNEPTPPVEIVEEVKKDEPSES